jgi:hypothetical protein
VKLGHQRFEQLPRIAKLALRSDEQPKHRPSARLHLRPVLHLTHEAAGAFPHATPFAEEPVELQFSRPQARGHPGVSAARQRQALVDELARHPIAADLDRGVGEVVARLHPPVDLLGAGAVRRDLVDRLPPSGMADTQERDRPVQDDAVHGRSLA